MEEIMFKIDKYREISFKIDKYRGDLSIEKKKCTS